MNPFDRLRQKLNTLTTKTDDDWQLFVPIVEHVTYQKNDFLIQEGQVERYIYYVSDRQVSSLFHLLTGRVKIHSYFYKW